MVWGNTDGSEPPGPHGIIWNAKGSGSEQFFPFNNPGVTEEVPEDRRAASMASVLEGKENSKRLGSLISMPRMILEEIPKLLLGVTSAPHICMIYTAI